MARLREDTVGILPAGALGVAFFFHLTQELRAVDGRVFFVERSGSASGRALRAAGMLHIGEEVLKADVFAPDLRACADEGRLPEVLLVCTQPDQLLGVIAEWVRLFESLHAGPEDAVAELPMLVLASNGIYFQRVRQFLLEKLEESTLLGRLPDLWPTTMPRLVAKLLRGVTIQTGQREGAGAEAVYRPGTRGLTRIAGGAPTQRRRASDLLGALGAWCEPVEDATPTRVEFDKALVNLIANLLGQLAAIDDAGHFHALTVAEIFSGLGEGEVRELVERVVEVGKAVHAYAPDEALAPIHEQVLASLHQHDTHIPSSLQWIDAQLRHGTLRPQLTPTEKWLLDPLLRYAHAAGLEDAVHYFDALTRRVEHRLALALAAV
jgi:hypothetical protein